MEAVKRATRASDEGVTVSALASLISLSESRVADILRKLLASGIVRRLTGDGEARWFLADHAMAGEWFRRGPVVHCAGEEEAEGRRDAAGADGGHGGRDRAGADDDAQPRRRDLDRPRVQGAQKGARWQQR